jgi:hypothetical protein
LIGSGAVAPNSRKQGKKTVVTKKKTTSTPKPTAADTKVVAAPKAVAAPKPAAPKAAPKRKRTEPKKPEAASPTMVVVTDEEVRMRAYFLSLEYRGSDRNDVDFWLLAERELRGR